MKKKLAAILLVLVAVISLTSCTSSNTTNQEKGKNDFAVTQNNGAEANKGEESKDNSADSQNNNDNTSSQDDNTFKVFNNSKFQVSFNYPSSWKANPANEKNYKGNSGYFVVNATLATDIDALVQSEANSSLSPYGTKPQIKNIKVQGQDARLVLPSQEQNGGFNKQAILFVKYPKDTKIDGQVYGCLVLIADKDHINGIADSLKFTAK